MIQLPVIDTHRLSILANANEREMLHFLHDLQAGPYGLPRIRQEMERVGFEEIRQDPSGSIAGRIGSGRCVILMEAHPESAGMAALVNAGNLIHELGMYGDFTLWVSSSPSADLHPECALATHPTALRIQRGYRGRMELNESHPLVQSAIATYEALFELPPLVDAGPASILGVPTLAFGPGDSNGGPVAPRQLVKAVQFYATFPTMYVDSVTRH
jgi:hypothetical protein